MDPYLCLPSFPFPPKLNAIVLHHVSKSDARRKAALSAIRKATGQTTYDAVLRRFSSSSLAREGRLVFDADKHPLREAFLTSAGLPDDTDLSQLHQDPDAKDYMLKTLTENPRNFQTVFDKFVRSVCIPHMARLLNSGAAQSLADSERGEVYHYQVFPCIRVVQPGDFSIGPHADVNYGHHPLSVNFYVPLTPIQGTSSLYIESTPGQMDWHPILGDYGEMQHFAGGMNTHWTTENMTARTRVSLDFRVIHGEWYDALVDGHDFGGAKDVYRDKSKAPYYSKCCLRSSSAGWVREGELVPPDHRVGYPFTVKPSRWSSVLQKNRAKRQESKETKETNPSASRA